MMELGSERKEQHHHHTHNESSFKQQKHDNNNKGQKQAQLIQEERQDRWRKVNLNNRMKELTKLVKILRVLEPPME